MQTGPRDDRETDHRGARWATAVVLVLLIGSVFYDTQALTRWLAYDDEGGYLYAAWRISLGELPYRDFLTPQLPLFLYPGALVLALSDLSVAAARGMMTLYVVATVLLTALTVRRIWGIWPMLLMLPLLLLQRDIFWAARFFRPEAPMLFWAALGLYLFVLGYSGRADRRHQAYLVMAGAALALSMLSKLFGALPMAGVGLFLLAQGVRRRDGRRMWSTGLLVGVPFLLIVGVVAAYYEGSSGRFIAAVLEHHLRQGSGTPWREVLVKTLRLYWDYIKVQPVYILLTGIGLVALRLERRPSATGDGEALKSLYAWQLPTLAAFLVMTRSLQERHLTYIVPTLAVLGGVGLYAVGRAITGERGAGQGRMVTLARRAAGVVAIAGALGVCLVPQAQQNAWVASWSENSTQDWARYIREHTAPDDYIMADYPGINFFARRAAPPIAAGISRGAALSGQILGAQLIQEIERYEVKMVLLNVAHGSHQFVNLQDYTDFKRYIQTHFALAERRQYDYRLLEIYARQDLWPGERVKVNLANQLELTGLRWLDAEAAPGEQLQVELRWRGLASMPADYWVTLRLMDEAGQEWGLGGKRLVDIDRETWWDSRGLEQAVLLPTTRWPVDEATIETFELPVNPGTPPGTYHVHIRVHAEGQWAGLPLLDQDGQPAGYDAPLGGALIVPAARPPSIEELHLATTLDEALGSGLSLLGYSLSTQELRQGDALQAKLCVRADEAPAKGYALRLRLVGLGQGPESVAAEAEVGAEDSAAPGADWAVGETRCLQRSLTVLRTAPGGEYGVEVALLDGDRIVAAVRLPTRLTVLERERGYTVPMPEQPAEATFGERPHLTLLGYDLPQRAIAAGGRVPITLYWRTEQTMDTSYTLFLHLIDESGQIRGQVDATPCGGGCPTTSWLPGEILADRYELPVAADAPTGGYILALGWYDGATGVRLPGAAAAGQALPDARLLLSQTPLSLR